MDRDEYSETAMPLEGEYGEPVDDSQVEAPPRGPNRTLVVALILSVLGFAALLVTILNAGEGPSVPTESPKSWDNIEGVNETTPLDLGAGNRSATVIVAAHEKTCWAGYIVSEPIEGCGKVAFAVSGSGKIMGLNVRHTSPSRAFLGVAVWAEDTNQQLERAETKKKLGIVAFTAYPPPPDAH